MRSPVSAFILYMYILYAHGILFLWAFFFLSVFFSRSRLRVASDRNGHARDRHNVHVLFIYAHIRVYTEPRSNYGYYYYYYYNM